MGCGCGCGCNGETNKNGRFGSGSGGGGGGIGTQAQEGGPGFQIAGLSWWVWILILSAAYSIYNYES